jgi:hypothetical protein
MKVIDTIVLEFKVAEIVSQEEILEVLEYFVIMSFRVKAGVVLSFKSKILPLKNFKHKFLDCLNYNTFRRNI